MKPALVLALALSSTASAGECLSPLLWEFTGVPCADETIECRCSEFFTWDKASGPVTYYEVQRKASTSVEWYTVCNLDVWLDAEDLETGEPIKVERELLIHFPAIDDSSFPREGVLYEYRVRACCGTGEFENEFGGWSGVVRYRAAPYACFESGVEVPCYTDDPVFSPPVSSESPPGPVMDLRRGSDSR